MSTVAFRVWPRLYAWLWSVEWLPFQAVRCRDAGEDELPDHLKRDLGLLDGRHGIGPQPERQSDELREALRRQPRPL